MSSLIAYLACLPLAVLVGYSIRRGSTCCVAAVEEVLQKRRWRRFVSFFLCSAFVTVVMVPAAWLGLGRDTGITAFPVSVTAAIGGAIFGLGAVVNGACNFGIVDRLGRGQLHFLFILPGLYLGVIAGLQFPAGQPGEVASLVATDPAIAAAWTLIALVLIGVLGQSSFRHKQERGTPGLPVAAHMAVIGGVGAVMTLLIGPWQYTGLAVEAAMPSGAAHVSILLALTGLFFALTLGAHVAARRDGTFRLEAPRLPGIAGSLAGGTLMGVAIALIPGGNDALVLSAIPSLSPSALVAYPAMSLSIAGLLMLNRRFSRA